MGEVPEAMLSAFFREANALGYAPTTEEARRMLTAALRLDDPEERDALIVAAQEARSLAVQLAEAAHRYLRAPKGEAQFLSKEERTERAEALGALIAARDQAREAGLLGDRG